MRRPWIYAAILMTLGSTTADAAYVIKLKNGNEYVTTRYWRDGRQTYFDVYGGVFGIDSSFISRIEQSVRPVPWEKEASVAERIGERKQGDSSGPLEKQSAPSESKAVEKASGPSQPKAPLKKDETVLKEYGELQTRFGQLNDLPRHEVHALDADIASFREKLSNSALAEAHKDEIDALRTLQRAIASYLKAAYP